MGIRTDLSSKSGTVFGEDVLKIEISGPKEDYLTVIDVPGIFRNHAEGLTTKEDIDLVNSLVRKYIRDKRTIILPVLPCNVDIATQEIIALAEEYDRQGERTLAVLTKPDLVHESSAQLSVCNLVSGKRKPLTLGYYIVRNRGADDDNKVVDIDTLETMFQKEPWSALPPEQVGVQALKTRLGALLAEITRREFPILRREIFTLLAKCNRDLESLGPARTLERDQRRYLGGIAEQFEQLTRDALTAQYSRHSFFEKPEMRLITCLVNLVDAFADSFRLYGQLYNFDDIGGPKEIQLYEDSVAPGTVDMTSVSSGASLQFHVHLRAHLKDYGVTIDDYPELVDIVPEHSEIEESGSNIMGWIKTLYLQSRGVDLGTVSSDLLSEAFCEQSYQWEPMARVCMGEAVRLIHHFMTEALRAVCPDDDIAEKIRSAIYEPVLERYKNGRDQAVLLVDIERRQSPFTLNAAFNQGVQLARGERMRNMLEKKAWHSQKSYGEDRLVINLDDVLSATTTKTNEQYLHQEIHDKLKSYYHLAVDRFVDNVFRQAVGYHLLFGPQGPLSVFTQAWVIDLDTDTLSQIVGEEDVTKARRQALKKRSSELKAALAILKA
ncbi:dynamin [Sporothrix schenckii 1099-18]|uniref:GED domain-containing protein n=2 Tax=Sporothrix schenckii TaxID=29908 RepID=U7Q667_SPOS1|nr:dynamin [Sporothrix schenckii 1099-18]ERT03328.1 hypothetical protein HMPREF1624_01639 [Sporothrix schenckii ATCC 58251]KJR84235.1 dynamin [Sporothrix schenckii 1099-18]